MMNVQENYLRWIDDKILEHQTQIARLTVARQVMEEMPATRLEVQVRRQLEGPKRTKRQPTRSESRVVEQHIINWLGEHANSWPIELINGLGIGTSKEARRPYYNAITKLVKQGALEREDGRYRLAGSALPAQQVG